MGSGSGSTLYEGFPSPARTNVALGSSSDSDLGSDSGLCSDLGSGLYEEAPSRSLTNMGSGLALYEPVLTGPHLYTTPSSDQCGFGFGFGFGRF